jgi:hypothetical protein
MNGLTLTWISVDTPELSPNPGLGGLLVIRKLRTIS